MLLNPTVHYIRALIVLLVVAIHALLLSLWWDAVHQALPSRASDDIVRTDRSPTIVFLLALSEPAAINLRRDESLAKVRAKHAKRDTDAAEPQPDSSSKVSNAAALSGASVFVPADVASAPVRTDQALRLDAMTIKKAIADAEHGTFREMAKNAGRLDDVEPMQPDKFAAAIARAAVPSLREMVAAKMAADKKEACRPAHGVFGGGSIGGATAWPFVMPNRGDCENVNGR